MTATQVVERQSPTTVFLNKDYPHLGDHAKQMIDTPGFKPFTNIS